MLRLLTIAVLILFSCSASALQVFFDCESKDGRQVYVQPVPSQVLWSGRAGMAMTTIVGRKPIILYDQRYFPQLQAPYRDFVLWHECGHFAHGHTQDYPIIQRNFTGKDWIERDADCFAMDKMRNAGYTAQQLERIMDQDFPIVVKALDATTDSPNHEKVRASYKERMAALKYCR